MPGDLLRPSHYGGPRADRPSDANTRSVAGGSTTVRSTIASPHFGQAKPFTPNTRHNSALQDRQRARTCGTFGQTRAPTRTRDANTPCCSTAGVHLVRPSRRHQRHQSSHKLQPAQLHRRRPIAPRRLQCNPNPPTRQGLHLLLRKRRTRDGPAQLFQPRSGWTRRFRAPIHTPACTGYPSQLAHSGGSWNGRPPSTCICTCTCT